ncbi:MAG: DUF1573 domain-containing protein [Bacteroidia bacterium]
MQYFSTIILFLLSILFSPIFAQSADPLFAMKVSQAEGKLQEARGKCHKVKGIEMDENGVPLFQLEAEAIPKTTVRWYEHIHNFNKIREGEIITYRFRLKNTGVEPLRISYVKPSCGCTVADWSKDWIASGEEGFVEVKFNSKNRPGAFQKGLAIYGNFEGIIQTLQFKGIVVPETQYSEQTNNTSVTTIRRN